MVDPTYIRSAWAVLTSAARYRKTTTYGDLVALTGWPGTPRGVSGLLDPVYYEVCQPRGLPDLSSIGVRKDTSTPGIGYYKSYGGKEDLTLWREQLERCWAFDWPAQPPGFETT